MPPNLKLIKIRLLGNFVNDLNKESLVPKAYLFGCNLPKDRCCALNLHGQTQNCVRFVVIFLYS